MKSLKWILPLLFAVAAATAVMMGQKAVTLSAENARLRSELEAMKKQFALEQASAAQKRQSEIEQLRAEAGEVHKLRGEVTQLRGGAKEIDKLRAENSALRGENQTLRTAASRGALAPSSGQPKRLGAPGEYPKESWTFSGYATPEDALVTAIWSMQQGNPNAYLDSLSPAEQERMAQRWQGKSEAEIAAKHQSDVSRITGIKVLGSEVVGPNEMLFQVNVGGADRTDTVSMVKVGDQWRFDGFRQPAK